jgi:hypothetical protein
MVISQDARESSEDSWERGGGEGKGGLVEYMYSPLLDKTNKILNMKYSK